MSADELNLDYPEHLNPFRQRRNTLARSFRGLKKALVRSFTGSDKDKPRIRPKPVVEEPTVRNVMSMPPEYTESQILLPRSRFSERISKRDDIRTTSVENNPFEGRDVSLLKTATGTPPKPAERKLRKRKKKAPVPPGSASGSVNESKWSLVSTDSEMSSQCYSESEIDYTLNNTENEKNEEIFKITREIVKFAEDTNNNNISDQMQNEKGHEGESFSDDRIPDTNADVKNDVVDHKDEHIQSVEVRHHDQSMHEEVMDVSSVTNANNTSSTENNNKECINNMSVSQTSVNNDSDLVQDDHRNKECNNDMSDSPTFVNKDSDSVQDDHRLLQSNPNEFSTVGVDSSESNSSQPTTNKEKQQNEEDVEIEKDVVAVTSHRTEDRLSVKGTVDFFESTYASPSPKIRKNILTKEKLLGSDQI